MRVDLYRILSSSRLLCVFVNSDCKVLNSTNDRTSVETIGNFFCKIVIY